MASQQQHRPQKSIRPQPHDEGQQPDEIADDPLETAADDDFDEDEDEDAEDEDVDVAEDDGE